MSSDDSDYIKNTSSSQMCLNLGVTKDSETESTFADSESEMNSLEDYQIPIFVTHYENFDIWCLPTEHGWHVPWAVPRNQSPPYLLNSAQSDSLESVAGSTDAAETALNVTVTDDDNEFEWSDSTEASYHTASLPA